MQNPLLNFHRHSYCTHKLAKLNSTDQKFTVHDLQSPRQHKLPLLLCSSKTREVPTWLSHWRSGQSQQPAKLSLTPQHRAEDSGSSTLQRPPQLYPFITRLNTISLLHQVFFNSHPKTYLLLSQTSHTYQPSFSVLFFFTSRFPFQLPPQVCLAPHLSAATSSSITHQCSATPLHQSRCHLPVIPSQTTRQLFLHASHA